MRGWLPADQNVITHVEDAVLVGPLNERHNALAARQDALAAVLLRKGTQAGRSQKATTLHGYTASRLHYTASRLHYTASLHGHTTLLHHSTAPRLHHFTATRLHAEL